MSVAGHHPRSPSGDASEHLPTRDWLPRQPSGMTIGRGPPSPEDNTPGRLVTALKIYAYRVSRLIVTFGDKVDALCSVVAGVSDFL